MTSRVSYTMSRGLEWQRLVVVKNRRTRRTVRPTEARCTAEVGDRKIAIPLTITNEGGILLSLTEAETLDFVAGTSRFDVVAKVRDHWVPVITGDIVVEDLDLVTALEDAQQMEIRFRKGEDYRTTINWTDDEGNLNTITNAWLQAVNAQNHVVIDLRWYETPPSENAIAALTGARRGYLAPIAGESMEIHISDKNTVAAGTYAFDLFVEDSTGDATCLAVGNIVVEPSVSTKPV